MEGFGNATAGGIQFHAGEDSAPGTIQRLDEEIDRLDNALDQLAHKVGPISNQYAEVAAKLSEPRPEPRTQLLGRVERLSLLTTRLQHITSEIDL